MMPRRNPFFILAMAAALLATAGCRSKKPVVVAPPAPLDAASAAALRWIDAHAVAFPIGAEDAGASAPIVTALQSFVGGARVVGISELTEGTHEFPAIIRQILRVGGGDGGFRGLAVQASMAEAFELDRYVRTGTGNPQRLLRALGPHWETREMLELVEWMRSSNRARASAAQIGFAGFELPNATHAVRVVTTLPDSVAGAPLNRWLGRELSCVGVGESAAWGRGSIAADSGFWNHCRDVTAAAVDSLTALGTRVGAARASGDVAFAAQMARLLHHHVSVGLRRLSRYETVAEHVLWAASTLAPEGKLLVWGRDVESGRLTLEGDVVQSAVALSKSLGDRYRNLAFTFGEGVIRAQPIAPGRDPGDPRNIDARPPSDGSYENVLNRARLDLFFVDMRPVATDAEGAWLRGPNRARLISGVYTAAVPGAFETQLELPANYDGLIFARRVTPATALKR